MISLARVSEFLLAVFSKTNSDWWILFIGLIIDHLWMLQYYWLLFGFLNSHWSVTHLKRKMSDLEDEGLEKLIPVINKLQTVFTTANVRFALDLPQIVVIGSQSSGK